jgi:hypothetical protein
MPAAFDRCVAEGGKVRTISLPGDKYLRTCRIDGRTIKGEVKKKKKSKKKLSK